MSLGLLTGWPNRGRIAGTVSSWARPSTAYAPISPAHNGTSSATRGRWLTADASAISRHRWPRTRIQVASRIVYPPRVGARHVAAEARVCVVMARMVRVADTTQTCRRSWSGSPSGVSCRPPLGRPLRPRKWSCASWVRRSRGRCGRRRAGRSRGRTRGDHGLARRRRLLPPEARRRGPSAAPGSHGRRPPAGDPPPVRSRRTTRETSPSSTYSAPGGLRQDPDLAAQSPAEAGTGGDDPSRCACGDAGPAPCPARWAPAASDRSR